MNPCVRYVVYKYFLPVCSLSFHPLNKVFCRANFSNFDEVQFIGFLKNYYFMDYAFDVFTMLFTKP